MPQPDHRLADFEAQRPRLLRLAYRMTGSLSEAEDIVQEAWLRWSRVEGGVDAPDRYLTRIVTRLCLDQIKSARARRETYVGPWLPDPLLGAEDPDESIADEITLTLMLTLERLSPLERAAFLLHDVFEVPFDDVAATLERDPAAVRQLAVRARRHVRKERPRFPVTPDAADRIARAFFAAARDGDADALGMMLADDVRIHSDGGGKVMAFRNIVRGLPRVLRFYARFARKTGRIAHYVETARIDGLPGFVSIDGGGVLQTTALELRDDRITAIYIVRNPDKLRHITATQGSA